MNKIIEKRDTTNSLYFDWKQIPGFISAFDEDQLEWYNKITKDYNFIKGKPALEIIHDISIWPLPFVKTKNIIDHYCFNALLQFHKDNLGYEYWFEKSKVYLTWLDMQYYKMKSLSYNDSYWKLLRGKL